MDPTIRQIAGCGWRLMPLVLALACANTDLVSSSGRGRKTDAGGENPTNDLGNNQAGEEGENLGGDDGTPNDLIGDLIMDSDNDAAAFKVPRFGLLVNDLECALCHVRIHGDVVSTATVNGLWENSVGTVTGTWFAAQGYDVSKPVAGRPEVGRNVSVTVAGSVPKFYRGPELPKDVDGDDQADFPRLAFDGLDAKMRGRVMTPEVKVDKVHRGNLVLLGTPTTPIEIAGEVLIKGDLVIKGVYRGIGNIYVTGNVYIPADLKAKDSAFPFPEDSDKARAHAQAAIRSRKDALALATPRSVFISDIEDHGTGNHSVYTHPKTPDGRRAEQLGVDGIYSWFPGGKAAYDGLYERGALSCDAGRPDNQRSFNLIEAYLYAENTIGGRANRNSYAINGGIIADHFHIISAAGACGTGAHPVHQLERGESHVSYDYRMREGLLLLKQFAPFFGGSN